MSVSAEVFTIPQGDVGRFWHLARYWVEQACRKGPGGLDPDRLRDDCADGRAHLFVVIRDERCIGAAVVTAVMDRTGRLVMEWTALGGEDFSTWADHEGPILEQARRLGCVAVRSYSRPGMKRVLGKRGYRMTGVILEKDL